MNLNGAHVHLLLNHLPVVGMLGATLLLAWAVIGRGGSVRRVALVAVVAAGLAAVPVYLTGDAAEETIEHLPGVDKHRIEEHDDSATWALGTCILAGVVALGGLVLSRRKPAVPRGVVGVTLAVSLLACLALARTANLGGEIRHPEVRSGFAAPAESTAGEARGGETRSDGAGEHGDHDGD